MTSNTAKQLKEYMCDSRAHALIEHNQKIVSDLTEIEKIVAFHLTGKENEYPAGHTLLNTISKLIKNHS